MVVIQQFLCRTTYQRMFYAYLIVLYCYCNVVVTTIQFVICVTIVTIAINVCVYSLHSELLNKE